MTTNEILRDAVARCVEEARDGCNSWAEPGDVVSLVCFNNQWEVNPRDRDSMEMCFPVIVPAPGEPVRLPWDDEIDALKGAMAADDERLRKAAERVGLDNLGCDAPDWMADTILAQRRRITELEAENERLERALEDSRRVNETTERVHAALRAKHEALIEAVKRWDAVEYPIDALPAIEAVLRAAGVEP